MLYLICCVAYTVEDNFINLVYTSINQPLYVPGMLKVRRKLILHYNKSLKTVYLSRLISSNAYFEREELQ